MGELGGMVVVVASMVGLVANMVEELGRELEQEEQQGRQGLVGLVANMVGLVASMVGVLASMVELVASMVELVASMVGLVASMVGLVASMVVELEVGQARQVGRTLACSRPETVKKGALKHYTPKAQSSNCSKAAKTYVSRDGDGSNEEDELSQHFS
ncbi:hypothetical protein RUM43_004801 [Polyplax serrata]|uniref:Uncharacterized protein n=1 Tax=Polyplax serrata TaxID=468196 RepID=A0AAN8SC38_POLSC